MAKDLSEQLTRLGHKAELLVTRFATLKDENAALKEQVQELDAKLQALTATNEKLSTELEFLRISAAIAPGNQDAHEAKAIISGLVREIDACVADLMKDI